MEFKELFEKYKNNTANDEEKKQVERLIEQYQIIGEYMIEHDELKLDNLESDDYKDEIATMQSVIQKRFIKMIVITTISVCMILGGIYFIRPFLYPYEYYDPETSTIEGEVSDLSIEFQVFSELYWPIERTVGNVSSSGSGTSYNLSVQMDAFQSNALINAGDSFYQFEMVDGLVEGLSVYGRIDYSEESPTDKASLKKQLESMSEATDLITWIQFSNNAPMMDIIQLINKYPDTDFRYISVYSQPGTATIGFNTFGVAISDNLMKQYPYLDLYHIKNPTDSDFENHFKELLKFQLDHLELASRMLVQVDDYSNISEYVNKNGVLSNGVVIVTSPSQLIKMLEEDNFRNINVRDARIKIPDAY